MIERTVFISQHSMDISNFTSHRKINIIFFVFISDNDRCTALNVSAGRVYFELFNYFIKMGSDIYLKTNNGKIVFILQHAMDI